MANVFGHPITNWICGGCKAPVTWFAERTDCCGKRAIGGYSNVRCPFCTSERNDLAHWSLWSDGVTRPCPCSVGCVGPDWWPGRPNPDKGEGIAAAVLAVVLDALVPGCVPVPVVDRYAGHHRATQRRGTDR